MKIILDPHFCKNTLFLPETHKKELYFSDLYTYLKKLCFSVIHVAPGWGVQGGPKIRTWQSSAEVENDRNFSGAIIGQ